MNRQKFIIGFFANIFCLFFLATQSIAKPYFTADSISPTLLDPPIASNSKNWQNEVKQIIELQKKFDLEELDLAASEKNLKPDLIAKIDPVISRNEFPRLYYLLDRVGETSKSTTENFKNYWKTSRPYLTDHKIKMLITPSAGFSYPSGHTSGSFVYAHVLGLLIPQRRESFEKYAEQIAQRRILVGMHFPHDIEGGKKLALILVGALTQNPEFQHDFKEAQKEISNYTRN